LLWAEQNTHLETLTHIYTLSQNEYHYNLTDQIKTPQQKNSTCLHRMCRMRKKKKLFGFQGERLQTALSRTKARQHGIHFIWKQCDDK